MEDDWKVIHSYGDREAVEDGTLIPLYAARRDTGHRVTRNAFEELKSYYKENGHAPTQTNEDFARFLLNELLPLTREAERIYRHNIGGGILKTTYDFRVTQDSANVMWIVPNENSGVTLMRPEDY